MQFYVPTIGDSIYLLEPWTFTLHREGRNQGLAKRLAQCGRNETHYHHYRVIKAKEDIFVEERGFDLPFTAHQRIALEKDKEFKLYDYHPEDSDEEFWNHLPTNNFMKQNRAKLEILRKESDPYQTFTWNGNSAEVTLPMGTQLTVARIYIKSTYRDFDSITWRIGECKENPKLKKARFWVKLKDANKIVCDLYPVVDEEAAKRYAASNRFKHLGDE